MARKVRWGHLSEIRRIRRVPGKAFRNAPRRLQHLSAWRRMHTLGTHRSVSTYARVRGVKPSSNLKIRGSPSKLRYIAQKGG